MTILLAASGGIAFAGGDPNAGVDLPASINLSRSGVDIHEVRIRFSSNALTYGDSSGSTQTTFDWNTKNKDRSKYQVRLLLGSGAPAPTTGAGNTWYGLSNTVEFLWRRDSVGTTSGSYTLQLRNVDRPDDIILSTPVSINLQRQSYGIVLNFPTSVSTSGTTARNVLLNFTGNSNNNIVLSRSEGTVGTYNWNPNGHSRSLFQVRMVHTSGTAPTSGSGGSWRDANLASSWRWDRSSVGSTSGGIRIEIREKATGTILASRNLSVSLTQQSTYTQFTITVQRRSWGGDKAGGTVTGYVKNDIIVGPVGTISPNPPLFKGVELLSFAKSDTSSSFGITFDGLHPQNFFSRIEVVGYGNLYPGNATWYNADDQVFNQTAWNWNELPGVLVDGATRTIRFYP